MIRAKDIQAEIRSAAKKCPQSEIDFVRKYLGTKRKFICVKSVDRDRIIRQSLAELKQLDPKKTIKILDELFSSDTFEDINFAGKILTLLPEARKNITFDQLAVWIKRTTGWAECDSIVQSLFDESEVLARWLEFEKAIKRFRGSKNIQLRRASLVLQCKPVRGSTDKRLRKLAFETVEKLKAEKEILITKAISWLLRDLSRQNKNEVKKYLESNKSSLPAIAYRETMRKIITGKK